MHSDRQDATKRPWGDADDESDCESEAAEDDGCPSALTQDYRGEDNKQARMILTPGSFAAWVGPLLLSPLI